MRAERAENRAVERARKSDERERDLKKYGGAGAGASRSGSALTNICHGIPNRKKSHGFTPGNWTPHDLIPW